MAATAVHGQAALIRSATENETFDLGGQNATTIASTMEAAFGTPFFDANAASSSSNNSSGQQAEMIRITLVTGAGKQARQKYDEAAAKTVTSILQKHGYVEDRGASCVLSSAGCYKLQHDTGKNRKTVVVFPKVLEADSNQKNEGGGASTSSESEESLLPENSPGYKIAVASMKVFPSMLERECASWSQKKACLEAIHTMQQVMQELDAKLIQGRELLTSAEQHFYNHVAVLLDEKEGHVKQQLAAHVEQGRITQLEKQILLQQNAERIQTLQQQNKSTTKAIERKQLIESITSVQPPHPLKHYNKIAKLYKELAPLQHLDADSKGRLLSVKETKALTRKEEILEEIEHWEESSRGWFEDDEAFASRVEATRRTLQSQYANKSTIGSKRSTTISSKLSSSSALGGGGGGGRREGGNNSAGGSAVNKWVTPGESGRGFSSAAKKKGKWKKAGGLFQAMMMDSSDEEEEDDDDEEPAAAATQAASTATASTQQQTTDHVDDKPAETPSEAASNKSGKKKSKKKKKKSKGKTATKGEEEEENHQQGEDEYLDSAVADAQARAKAEEEIKQEAGQTVLAQTWAFLKAYVFPIIVAILNWIIGLLFGKNKKQPKKKRG